LLGAEEFEQVFARLYQLSRSASFDIKTTEAQHYRRFLLQQKVGERNRGAAAEAAAKVEDTVGRAPRGLNDGKGFVFISHTGEVFPSGFLPLAAGNVRNQPLARIYRESPLFRSLRDTAQLEGKCGACEFRNICGGSRARAFALTGNPLGEEPCCVYVPRGYRRPPMEAKRPPRLHVLQGV
ncbi:MAG: SPASM domain-containing protein, partial [Acidobacteriota bacterium]